jgi:hypothetical protein
MLSEEPAARLLVVRVAVPSRGTGSVSRDVNPLLKVPVPPLGVAVPRDVVPL